MKKSVIICDACNLECEFSRIQGTMFENCRIRVSYHLADVDNGNEHDASRTVELDFCNANCLIYYFKKFPLVKGGAI